MINFKNFLQKNKLENKTYWVYNPSTNKIVSGPFKTLGEVNNERIKTPDKNLSLMYVDRNGIKWDITRSGITTKKIR